MKSKTYRLFASMLLPVVLAILLSISTVPGSIGEHHTSYTAAGSGAESGGAAAEWSCEEMDPPVGDSYMLFDVFGGFWADAEKDPNPGDDRLCWAATASNMLEYTGWGFTGGMEFGNTDDFFQFFRGHVTDKSHNIHDGIAWWFDGELPTWEGWAEEVVDHGGFWPSHDPADHIFLSTSEPGALVHIRNQIMESRPVGLTIFQISGSGVHAITCWGFNFDSNYTPYDREYYTGIWVTDSDSHKDQWNPPDVLRFYAVTWNGAEERWELRSYSGGWYIAGVSSLAIFPGATRPVADGGDPYFGYEGSPVIFDASGSADGGTLWYRWDLDNDGVWDTGWLTSATAEWMWEDDYDTNDVYLEVFNERLRDMSITTVTILNVAPVITAAGDVIDENGFATVSGMITDPGIHDSFTVEIHWGEGDWQTYHYDAGSTWYSETHQYLDDDPTGTPLDIYTVSVRVTDKDGGFGIATTTVTVNNVDPVVGEPHITGQPNEEFILPVVHEIDFEVTFTDVGTLDTHTAVWDWGDGTTSAGSVSQGSGSGTVTGSHTYMLAGDYVVTVTVTDDDTGSHSNTMMVHVADVDEALEIFNQYIQDLDDSYFRGRAAQRKHALGNMFSALQYMWLNQKYRGMIQDLRNNIRSKADGLIDGKANDDWISNQEAQEHICQKVDDITAYLEYLLGI